MFRCCLLEPAFKIKYLHELKMPSTRSSSPSKSISSSNGQVDNTNETKISVWMIERSILNVGGSTTPLDIIKLRHPRSGVGSMFLLSSDSKIIQEIFSFSDKRSWFINDSVSDNGNMHFSTPIDPLFLFLPFLKEAKKQKKIVPLEDLLVDSEFPESKKLLDVKANLSLIADRKGPEDLNAWSYNEDKAMKWLSKKVDRVVGVLKTKQINVRGSATSKNFIKTNDLNDLDNELFVKYAHELVCEYLIEDLNKKLAAKLGLPEESLEKKQISKRKSSQTIEQEINKKVKIEVDEPKVEKLKETAKDKALKKAASGSKSITSFFKKK